MTGSYIDDADIAVVGGGPGGLSAALWAARYRRRVVLFDDGRQRNRWARATHGYFGLDNVPPAELLDRARRALTRHRETSVVAARVQRVAHEDEQFRIVLADGRSLLALRLVLATGLRDIFPAIERFEEFYGRTVFTCPSCDGYEAEGKSVVVIGGERDGAALAIGLLDWAASVTLVVSAGAVARRSDVYGKVAREGVDVVVGTAAGFVGRRGELGAVLLDDGLVVHCEMAFCAVSHEQQSDLPLRLGCDINAEGSVVVDEHGQTTVRHVYAVGDMTPGPHLVQVAASKGAIAGIAAACSLRGARGVARSPQPAPDPTDVLHTVHADHPA
jgi:thioredoxin reductase